MRRAVITGLIFAAQAPAAEVDPSLTVSAQGAVIFMHIQLAGILPGQAIVEQKSADPLVPALRRRPVRIVVFHPRLRDGDVQHPGVVTEGGARKAQQVIAVGKRLCDLLLRVLFQSQSGKNFAVNAGLGMLLVFRSQIANLLLPDRLAIYFNI